MKNHGKLAYSKSLDFIDLRHTRPPKPSATGSTKLQIEATETRGKEKENIVELFSPVKNSREIDEEPPKKEVQRRASPKRRKREREMHEFPDGADVEPPSKSIFGDMNGDAIKKLHAMILNFCRLEDGSLTKDINLRQYSLDSGEMINNITVQEFCSIQPKLERLDLTLCTEVTDAALWSIARHCENIHTLILSGCDSITHVGLRSLSLRCSTLTCLDFSNCIRLDDMGLSVIAGGAWQLRHLLLAGCSGITDTGIGKLAKTCPHLEILNLKGCVNLGEFGNHALKELGSFCGKLRELDLTGCRRVEDQGLRALAVGCTSLEKLLLEGCENVTGSSLKALCKHSRKMQTLFLIGCRQLTDKDCENFHNCAFADTIQALDISGSVRVTDRGIAALCQSIGMSLRRLGIGHCQATDFSAQIIGNFCTNLRELDFTHCTQMTDDTVHAIANKVTALTTLKLDEVPRVTVRALVSHLNHLEFVMMANQWLGYQPRPNVEKMIRERENTRMLSAMALKIQCMIRKKIAFRVWKEKRRLYLMRKIIPKFQAHIRGGQQRVRWKLILKQIDRIKKAIRIQSWYRKYLSIQKRLRIVKMHRFQVLKQTKAVVIQRIYRGYIGKLRTIDRRNDLMNIRLREAQHQVVLETKALIIQRIVRGHFGRLRSIAAAQRKDQSHTLKLLKERMARFIQRVMRGKLGRMKTQRRRKEIAEWHRRWKAARSIQCGGRGMLARNVARNLRYQRWMEQQRKAATNIQRQYRGYRGRLLAAVARALQILRKRQQLAAIDVQRIVRGHLGRIHAEQYRIYKLKRERETRASIRIQRLFRGHKGREAYEIEAALNKLEKLARPLIELLKQLESQSADLSKIVSRMEFYDTMLRDDLVNMERELEQVDHTTAKYTDSSRINGIPQRFMTKYLRVRLRDHYEHEKEAHRIKFAELQKKRVEFRNLNKEIEAARRELIPLTTGKVAQMKRERSRRLREQVRNIRRKVCKIQALWRRSLVRTALKDPSRDYWIECYDAEQGEQNFYFNTWTKETTWKMPLSFRYFHAESAATSNVRVDKRILEEHLGELTKERH